MKNEFRTLFITIIIALSLLGCQTFLTPYSEFDSMAVNIENSNDDSFENITILIPDMPDSDEDGVLDNIDACPRTLKQAVVDDKGCPVAKELIGRLSMEVRVFFDDQSLILQSSNSAYNELNKVAIKMHKFPQATTTVFGNISMIEAQTNPQNRLARDRAQLVKEILMNQGVPDRIIQTFDCSDHRQIALNDTEEGESLNRRVYVRMFYNDKNDYLSQKDTYDCKLSFR